MVPTARKPWYRRGCVKLLLAFSAALLIAVGVLGFAAYRMLVNLERTQVVWEGPLTLEQRREIFDALWTTDHRSYAYLELKGIDWKARRAAFWPEAQAAPDDTAFYRVLERMVASLDDGHSRLVSYPGQQPVTAPPLTLGWVEEQYAALEVSEALAGRVTPDGTRPDSEVQPTIADIAAGRDPDLETALAVLRGERMGVGD